MTIPLYYFAKTMLDKTDKNSKIEQ